MRSIALNNYFRKYFIHCFAQANIEVIRGQQWSNFAECHIIFSEMCIYLRIYYRWQAAEKNTR